MNGILDKLRPSVSLKQDESANLDAPLQETQVSTYHDPKPMSFTFPPGSTPLPRYTVRRGIGVGGFGEVYFAVSEAGKEVALKRIQRNLEIELRGVSHCLNLKNPHLVSLFDVCQAEDQQWWVVMEYVAGDNLRQVLDRSPSGLSQDEVERWFTGIASGVAHLHNSGLVHRDLKPGNVFDDQGIVKVGDYGLSKFISASHKGGHTESVGTFHYMAPEIGRGQYGREIDIYALGVVLYELLTGQVPFDGESCQEIIVKHLTATPDVSSIAEPYRSTVKRCLEKDPSRRFPTVEAMMASLNYQNAQTSPGRFAPVERAAPSDRPVTARLVATHRADEIVNPALSQPVFHAKLGDSPQTNRLESLPRSTSDEPVARAVRESMMDLNRWWQTLDRSPGAKAFLLVAACLVMATNTAWLLPLLSVIAMVYVPYYVVRQMVLHVRQQPSYAKAQAIAASTGRPQTQMTKSQWRGHVRSQLRAKHSMHRIAELNTSWIAAILSIGVASVIAGIVGLRTEPISAMSIAPYAWTALIVLIASLGLLSLGKLWEREDGEGLTRRIALAGAGASVGAAAYFFNDYLMLPLNEGLTRDVDASNLPQTLYSSDGVPTLAAMMAHFALLFAVLRWWKPVDPLRRTRLSLWAVAVAVVVEWMVHQVLPIPQPTGMFVAGGIAFAIQMSAPWINPKTPLPNADFRPRIPETLPNASPSMLERETSSPVASEGELA